MEIRTIGDLRKALKSCEDEEPVTFYLWGKTFFGKEKKNNLELTNVGSTAGGRATTIWLKKK